MMKYLLKNPSVAAATPEIVVSGNINACPAKKKVSRMPNVTNFGQ